MTYTQLIAAAQALTGRYRPSEDCCTGDVGAVILSAAGHTYAGVCLDFQGGLGFCAEHAAVAEMVKHHEAEIAVVVAVDQDGRVLPPCGRCREMMWQLHDQNVHAMVVLGPDRAVPLADLLPYR